MKNYTTEELKKFSADELNEMVEVNEISWSEWIEAQTDTYNGYKEWCAEQGRERNDESARLFIREMEESMMDEEKNDEVEKAITAFEKYRNAKA